MRQSSQGPTARPADPKVLLTTLHRLRAQSLSVKARRHAQPHGGEVSAADGGARSSSINLSTEERPQRVLRCRSLNDCCFLSWSCSHSCHDCPLCSSWRGFGSALCSFTEPLGCSLRTASTSVASRGALLHVWARLAHHRPHRRPHRQAPSAPPPTPPLVPPAHRTSSTRAAVERRDRARRCLRRAPS